MVREYHQVPTSEAQLPDNLPVLPPSYDETEGSAHRPSSDSTLSDLAIPATSTNFQEFEIDDPASTLYNNSNRSSFLQQAGQVSRSIRSGFSAKIVYPITRLLDPIASGYRTLSIKVDVLLSKLGNPLIIRRFLYVFFISSLIYVLVASGLYPQNRASIDGQFNDSALVLAHIKKHLKPQRMEENLEYLSSVPHMAGTAGDLALARYINNVYETSGMNPKEFREETSFINYPDVVKFKLTKGEGHDEYIAKLTEDNSNHSFKQEREDKDNTQQQGETKNINNDLPFKSFNFLSADGKTESPIIYVNYAREIDFKFLLDSKISTKSAICLSRYGKIFAGSKLKHAANNGCKAIVYFKNPKFLDLSKDEQKDMIENQMVASAQYASGDVLTPGWPSLDSNPRIPWEKSEVAPQIPSIPVSYNDILPFLKALKNKGIKVDKKDWKFQNDLIAKDLDYEDVWTGSIDRDPVIGYLEVQTNKRESKPIWNIVGKISGFEQPEKAILIGAQRDSSCFGAIDPNTGTTVFLEMVELFLSLAKKLNWVPLRTIYFISIDGGNYNYAGITEWIESRFRELRKEIFAYVDLSDAISGDHLDVMSHPVFESLILDVLNSVDDPTTADLNPKKLGSIFKSEDFKSMNKYGNFYPFSSFVGVPSISIKFTNSNTPKDEYTSVYPKNSCYDTFENFHKSNIDPNMSLHSTLVEILMRVVFKLVDEPLIPYSFDTFYHKFNSYLDDLNQYSQSHLNLDPLRQGCQEFLKIGEQYISWINAWKDIVEVENLGIEPNLLSVHRWEWNSKLSTFLRWSIIEEGIPGRAWIKNGLFGPQRIEPEIYKNEEQKERYLWWTFPAIRDAVQENDWQRAQEEVNRLSQMIKDGIIEVFGQ